jgi:hypothetical protein
VGRAFRNPSGKDSGIRVLGWGLRTKLGIKGQGAGTPKVILNPKFFSLKQFWGNDRQGLKKSFRERFRDQDLELGIKNQVGD